MNKKGFGPMQKKRMAHIGILCFICSLALCACGNQNPLPQAETQTPEPSTAPESNQETEEAENMNELNQQNIDYDALFKDLKLTKSYKEIYNTNPLMSQRFGADPYAMVYGDRVYFYMTADAFEYDAAGNIVENTYGKISSINVISTSDMMNFTDHGSIQAASSTGAATWARNSWAPAAAWKEIDGKPKFFLYFADNGGGIGVLTADSPIGPFTDPLGKGLITRETPNCSDVLWLFDPAVLVDDDGKAYLYFGGGVPEGRVSDPGTARVVQLGDDMISIVGEPVRIDVPYLFEDSGIHKAGDKYYYTYCSNWQVDDAGTEKYGFHNAEIVSMESDSPMGPFTVKETILENPGRYFGLYGNNHHCVFNFQGNWYITYHTRVLEQAMGVEHGYRSTHVDSFTMQEDGTIGKIRQTKTGREQLCYVDPYQINRAANIAVMGGIECIPADAQSMQYGVGNMAVGSIDTGDFILVKGVDFGDESPARMSIRAKNPDGNTGVIQVRIDKPFGDVLGYLPVDSAASEFTEFTADLALQVTDVHDLYFIFYGEGYEIDTWQFSNEN